MEQERKDGLPAFPLFCGPGDLHNNEGMSLRDYFAAKAMQGVLADPSCEGEHKATAKWAYEMADAMLAARAIP